MIRFALFLFCFCCITQLAFAQPQVNLSLYASGLSSPVDIAHANDDRLFVVERSGTIRIVDAEANVQATPFLDISDRVQSFGGQGEIGFLGLAFHPNYADNGFFYVFYTNNDFNSTVARFQVNATDPNLADPDSEEVMLVVVEPFLNHNGGKLAFGPDGYLYVGFGDGGSAGDPGNRSQNLEVLNGKMLRLDVDNGLPYTIPSDNPYVGDLEALGEIWAHGLRNPWRFSFDRMTGDLWIGDVGQGTWEEVDFEPAGFAGGANYGWRCYEGNAVYNDNGCNGTYTAPLYAYNHDGFTHCSITGGYVYRGNQNPTWQGHYFYSDFCSGKLWSILKEGDDVSNFEIAGVSTTSITSFGEDRDGELYALRLNGNMFKFNNPACTTFDHSATVADAGCVGANEGAIELTVSGGAMPYSFAWSNDETTQNLSNLAAGIYDLTITDNNDCLLFASYTVEGSMLDAPQITATGDTEVCEGGVVVLTANNAPTGYGYQWYLDDVEISETDQTLFTNTSGMYHVAYTGDACGTIDEISNVIEATIIALPSPPFITADGVLEFCDGNSVTLTAPLGPAGYALQWYNGGTALGNVNETDFVVETAGQYNARYTGLCTSMTSNWLEVTINPTPPAATINYIGNEYLCDGEIITLLGPTLSTPFGYQWMLNGLAIDGATSATYGVLESGTYYVAITGNDCPAPDTSYVTFQDAPPITIPDLIVINDTLFSTTGYANYQFVVNGNVVSDSADPFTTDFSLGKMYVVVIDEFGCTATSPLLFIDAIEELGFSQFDILPNPFKNDLAFFWTIEQSQTFTITLLDTQGRTIKEETISASLQGQRVYDLKEWSAGLYLLRVETEKGFFTQKIIKQ